eukprot:1429549-Prymnesium_polylepis.1
MGHHVPTLDDPMGGNAAQTFFNTNTSLSQTVRGSGARTMHTRDRTPDLVSARDRLRQPSLGSMCSPSARSSERVRVLSSFSIAATQRREPSCRLQVGQALSWGGRSRDPAVCVRKYALRRFP